MAKGKVKKKTVNGSKPHKPQGPTLNPDLPANSNTDEIFSGLHSKIEAELQKVEEQRLKPAKVGKATSKADKGPKGENRQSGGNAPRGKKRNNGGTVVDHSRIDAKSISKPLPKKDPQVSKGVDDVLQNEIIALGGTSEDLQLLDGLDSGSEVEGYPDSKTDRGLSDGLGKGISNILREIALAQKQAPASESSNDEAEDEAESEAESTDADKPGDSVSRVKAPSPSIPLVKIAGLKCNPRPDWFGVTLPTIDLRKQPKYTLSQQNLGQLHDLATTLLGTENEVYQKQHQKSSSHSFYNTVIASGTLSDKISALTLAVQESPLHNVKALETLIGLAKKRSRAQAVEVLRALKDLFGQGSLLPSDRKLYAFHAQPTLLACFGKVKTWNRGEPLPQGVNEGHLVVWAFESWLKEQYFEVLKTLEIWCNDELEFSKSRAVSYVFELLKEKPEQESNLLRLLINKLGDPIKKIASQTSYLIMQLLSAHPAMKGTVISAIEADFIFRPGQSLHSKYYAAVTLNQTALSSQEQDVAVKLLDIYFGLFVALLKPADAKIARTSDDGLTRGQQRRRKERAKKASGAVGESHDAELQEKLISAVLTGVNRAYPYTDKDGHDLGSYLDTLFRITHSSNFSTSIQAMMLIQQMSSSNQVSVDRFYRTLYESLLDARLATSSKQQLYLNLLHRALKADLNLKRVKAFVRRILQILGLHEPSFICGAFFLLSDLENTFPGLKALLDQPEDHDLDEEEVFRDVDEEPGDADATNIHPDRRHASQFSSDPHAYDARKRDPEHSNAENSCAWDLLPFLGHFHPSVMVSADHLLRHTKLPGKPDLKLHTLSHFLDRFVYRNPKLSTTHLRGSSIMQPMANDDTHAVLISGSTSGTRSLPVNSDQFRSQKDGEVAADHVFFHKYFSGLSKEPAQKKTKKARIDAEGDDGSIGNEEDEVWKAMMESAPHLEGDDVSEDDLEMSDLESEFSDDDLDVSDGEADDVQEDAVEGDIFDPSDDDPPDLDDGEHSASEVEEQLEDMTMSIIPGKKAFGEVEGRGKKPLTSKEKKRKMKGLPTFASAADYAKMLEDDADEDMG